MRITMKSSAAARVNGVATSLVRGKSYDLPDTMARGLIRGRVAERAEKAPKPEGDKPKPPRKRAAKKAPAKKATGPAPENK